MKLSILIFCYNQENYIGECIQGLLLQDFHEEVEIIVADDCSSDSTVKIIRQMLTDSGRNFVITERDANIGREENFRLGFAMCKGEYIAVLEGDDYWTDPLRLRKHIEFLDSHRECSASFNRFAFYHENGRHFSVPSWLHGCEDFAYITTSQMAQSNRIGNMSSMVIRASCLKRLDTQFWEMGAADWGFGMALGRFGLLAVQKELMSVYRIHKDGLWSRKNAKEIKESMLRGIDRWDLFFQGAFKPEIDIHRSRFLKSNFRIFAENAFRKLLPKKMQSKIIKILGR